MSFVRKIEVEGRLSIPKEFRDRNHIYCGSELIIKTEVDKLILIIPQSNCILCCKNTGSKLIDFKGKIVCYQCLKMVKANSTALERTEELLDKTSRTSNLIKMKKLIELDPEIKQYQIAEILGISRSRVSQMKKSQKTSL
ncbi:AbrB/MazE/SpoVT family DNA-binding domain-containing protein [Paenibacillus sp. 37]|uniref:AbrB/MazE/SpoVT family DNA-binding domain-containing protein n=1 Tax=Paenibacillus sp. 37 TaxID=2607911 RepID=UPI00122E3D1C|nr:AbrB/MazE/SpoVT family DNA-binding domain-containing protein [Paenibacillus sp. 37]